ncbi:MAG TPA: translation elongation factor Ts [Gammaproteobacteria bacterium]|nr:translation elongation factor Ts [Gammaproteobacteria bacterium]
MAISAAQVKELRERTGSGMMECKKALVEADGDMDAAVEILRKSGLAKADKKAGRVAAEGLVVIETSADRKDAVMAEVNCETDFVAKKEEFQDFAAAVARRILSDDPADVDALLALPLQDGADLSVEEARKELVAKLGENINVRRFVHMHAEQGALSSYLHGTRIGVLVDLEGGDEQLGRDLAMHVAASRPVCVAEQDVPQELLDKEREIFVAQAESSGKPPEIIEKMVQGRLKKYLGEVTLLGQPFVKDPDTTVAKLLDKAGARVVRFDRLELGEGIEKKTENFADEVMAQVHGS